MPSITIEWDEEVSELLDIEESVSDDGSILIKIVIADNDNNV